MTCHRFPFLPLECDDLSSLSFSLEKTTGQKESGDESPHSKGRALSSLSIGNRSRSLRLSSHPFTGVIQVLLRLRNQDGSRGGGANRGFTASLLRERKSAPAEKSTDAKVRSFIALVCMRLSLALCSTSASPRCSMSGGMYIANRPRKFVFRPYQLPIGLSFERAQCSTVPAVVANSWMNRERSIVGVNSSV